MDLTTLDFAVNDAKTRLQRVPYSKHERTHFIATPIDRNTTYDDLLQILEHAKPKVEPFNIESYLAPKEFTDYLTRLDNKLTKLEIQEQKAKAEERRKRSVYKVPMNSNVSYSASEDIEDLRELVRIVLGEPEHTTADYNIYKCPFHNDNTASAVCGNNVFYCFTCGASYNWFNFIKHYYNLTDNKHVFMKKNELMR